MDQTRASADTHEATRLDLTISNADRQTLQKLAAQVAELAARPCEAAKRELWYQHNALQATRPLIFCDPENGWNEIITADDLVCTGDLARNWEMRLRKEVFWGSQMNDDRVTLAQFDIAHVHHETDWGLHETRVGGENGGSYVWESPVNDYARDLPKLQFPKITVDYEQTNRLLELAQETLGDKLCVRLHTQWWWTLGMTWTLIKLRGLERMMTDMALEPKGLGQIMAFLRDGTMARLDFLQQEGLLDLNTGGEYVGSGGFGWTHELPGADYDGHVRTQDMWGFGESQETVGVSPRMFERFVFQYQLPLLSRFGLNCYGCCEPLDKRWHVVSKVPNLRRVSVSPWSDTEAMAEKLSDQYIFSWKPSPSDLAMDTFDEDHVRKQIRHVFEITRGCRVEAIMKDNHTIRNEPSRVVDWVRIAQEEADRL